MQFHLDYLSCCLTVIATVLVGRKSWTGLAISSINSLIICVIGIRTGQLGFIPANLFCICIYAVSIRSWLREKRINQNYLQEPVIVPVAEAVPMNSIATAA